MKKSKRGFTLVETLTVIVIIAILATIAVPSVSGILSNANRSVDNANAGLYESALKIYVSQKAQYREYVNINQIPTETEREYVANSIAMIIDDGGVVFECKTNGWAFYYHPVTLSVVAAEYPDNPPAGMIALVDDAGEPLAGDPAGTLLGN